MISKAPHVAAVHDLSGMGRCSLGVVLPILSAMGCWCSALPTAYLSASTIFPASSRFVFQDLTAEMAGSDAHWRELGVHFDALYSGFVGSAWQIEVLETFLEGFRDDHTLLLVDPVMGDWGRTYRTYTPLMCRKMCRLAALADVITPNLTEAAILLGEDYAHAPDSESGWREWLERLSGDGKRSVILTGIKPERGLIGAGSYDRDAGESTFAITEEEPAEFPGTGDIFSSVALGELLQGRPLAEAARRAVEFVAKCARETLNLHTPIEEGVQFESFLVDLTRERSDGPGDGTDRLAANASFPGPNQKSGGLPGPPSESP